MSSPSSDPEIRLWRSSGARGSKVKTEVCDWEVHPTPSGERLDWQVIPLMHYILTITATDGT